MEKRGMIRHAKTVKYNGRALREMAAVLAEWIKFKRAMSVSRGK